MSSIIHIRGEAGGGVAAHLQCPHCGHFSNSHAHQLSHVAAAHPAQLDRVAVGRLGNILMYQSGARLFHCSDCFYTSRDFSKIYKHIISKHCTDQREGGEEEEEEDEEEARKDAPVRKRSSEAEEEEEEGEESLKGGAGAEQSVLMFDGAGYRCLICGWKNKMKALGVNHVVRKHDIPKAYASQAIRRDAASTTAGSTTAASTTASTSTSTSTTASSTVVTSLLAAPPEEEEEETASVGLSGELLKEEVEATAKVVRFISNRFVCLICGWKTKLKGFAISHVVRFHDVERPYGCKDCARSFFLPSRLQQHVRAAHRPGRYACPFCCFRSHFLGGFRRHCSRCNAREEGGGEGEGRRGARGEQEEEEAREQQQEEEEEERKEVRGRRKRRRTRKAMEEEEEEEEEQEDDD